MQNKFTKEQRQERAIYLAFLKTQDRPRYITEIRELPEVGYPGGITAYYDEITDNYFNGSGQLLKKPTDYHADNDGRYY
jgi:hypothetical protein